MRIFLKVAVKEGWRKRGASKKATQILAKYLGYFHEFIVICILSKWGWIRIINEYSNDEIQPREEISDPLWLLTLIRFGTK